MSASGSRQTNCQGEKIGCSQAGLTLFLKVDPQSTGRLGKKESPRQEVTEGAWERATQHHKQHGSDSVALPDPARLLHSTKRILRVIFYVQIFPVINCKPSLLAGPVSVILLSGIAQEGAGMAAGRQSRKPSMVQDRCQKEDECQGSEATVSCPSTQPGAGCLHTVEA